VLIFISLISIALAACSPQRTEESLEVLSRLREPVPAGLVEREAIAYEVAGRARQAYLYRPAERSWLAPVVLVPGVAPRGRDDPRLANFARQMAAARFLVLVPEIENLRRLQVDPADAVAIADAVVEAERRSGSGAPVGLVGISYAVGPTVLAALDERLEGRVSFILSIGGYYSSPAVITFFTTGAYRKADGEEWAWMEPNPKGKWVFVLSNIDEVESPGDRELLRAMAEAKLSNVNARIDGLAARLGPEGQSILALLENRDPNRVPELLEALPTGLQDRMNALDLARRDLSGLELPVLLLHGRNDAIIPYTESLALKDALPPGGGDLFLLDNFSHVELEEPSLEDTLTLLSLVYSVLRERDEAAEP
jgi:pimeloyl-ACP methyl ester carboxylesterase